MGSWQLGDGAIVRSRGKYVEAWRAAILILSDYWRDWLVGADTVGRSNQLIAHHDCKVDGQQWTILDITGIIQLELSGAFEKIIDKYGDTEKYPYGPPSPITRQIIDNPDTPVWNSVQGRLFFEHRTGIGLLIAGFVLQLGAVWIWV